MFVRASKTGVCLQNVKAGRGHITRWRSVVRRVFRIAPAGGGKRAAATTRRLVTRTGTNHDWSPRRSGSKLLYQRTCYFKFRFYTVSLRLRFYSNHYNIINDIIINIIYFTEFSECYRFNLTFRIRFYVEL